MVEVVQDYRGRSVMALPQLVPGWTMIRKPSLKPTRMRSTTDPWALEVLLLTETKNQIDPARLKAARHRAYFLRERPMVWPKDLSTVPSQGSTELLPSAQQDPRLTIYPDPEPMVLVPAASRLPRRSQTTSSPNVWSLVLRANYSHLSRSSQARKEPLTLDAS